MNVIIFKRYNYYKKILQEINYNNPLINTQLLKNIKKLKIELINCNVGFKVNNKITRPLGFYEFQICDVVNSKHIFTNIEIEHLNNIIDILNINPLIIEIDDKYKIINKYYYKKIQLPDNSWVSPSQLKNYILKDTIIDYFKYNKTVHKKYNNINNIKEEINTFQEQIFNKGNQYENRMIEQIINKFPNNNIIIGKSIDSREYNNYYKTKQSIKNKIPIIFQAVLWNSKNKTFGCADILIRQDYIKIVFPKIDYNYDINNGDKYYEVFDFKWSKIQLKVDTDLLYNNGLLKVYKSQMYIYNNALAEIQNYKPKRAYIIAREFYREKCINKVKYIDRYEQDNFNDITKIGIIDFSIEYEIETVTKKAMEWLNFVKNNKNLEHDPPNDIRLYPNMKNMYDTGYKKIKTELAEKNKEITLLYSIGVEHRNLAISQGIKKYDDRDLTCNILNITGKKRKIIEEIININRSNEIIKFDNLTNFGNWKTSKIKLYLDIETLNNVVYDLGCNKPNYIFMIGLGIVENDKWTFKNYYTDIIDPLSEHKILRELENDINNIRCNNDIPIFHWGNFENYTLKPFINLKKNFNFYDMNKWFMQDGIYIKHALNFKLKSIIKALQINGLLHLDISSTVGNGSNAMNDAFKFYQNNDKTIMDNIIKYNEIDCISMYKIHQILYNLDNNII